MDIYEEMAERRKAGQAFVLTTIVKTAGPSPRLAGAKMLVYPDGSISGTIGGGNFEKMVIDDSLELLNSGERHLLKRYSFSQMGKDATGMSCGGEGEIFMEVHAQSKKLYIFGAGHICKELTRLARGSDFVVHVIDDRVDLLSEYRAPVKTIQIDLSYTENFPALDRDSFVVIVTRSHKHDDPVLEQAIGCDCAYIGMIGSKAKIRKMYDGLEAKGVDRARLERVHAPIGLNIKGEGPYEIAVSILAELIAVKHEAK